MTTVLLTAQGRINTTLPSIIEVNATTWRRSLVTMSWSGGLVGTSLQCQTYWADPRDGFASWPTPQTSTSSSTIPPGFTVSTTSQTVSIGAPQSIASDSPSPYLHPCAMRVSTTNANDTPRYTWLWIAYWDTTQITLTDGAAVDVDSNFRASVTIGTRVSVDGGTP